MLLGFVLGLGSPEAFGQTFSQTLSDTVDASPDSLFFTFFGLPTVVGDIEVSLTLDGDFDNASETVELSYLPTGAPYPPYFWVPFGTTQYVFQACLGFPVSGGTWQLPSSSQHINGNFYVLAETDVSVSSTLCTSSPIEVTISFQSVDNDGDGSFEGIDCDDSDAANFPGNPEICDGADNDCDPLTNTAGEAIDADGDGEIACLDCDDNDPNNFYGNIEVCDGLDNDCSGGADFVFSGGDDDDDDSAWGGVTTEFDSDLDGYFNCAGDCDDLSPLTNPGASELCDATDNDCDDSLPAEEMDADADGVMECAGDCNDQDDTVLPGATELCDGLDNDCNLLVPMDESDEDEDGFRPCGGDCDDENEQVMPEAAEVCDGLDNDCDSVIPEQEIDGDQDGLSDCEGDCDDDNPDVSPGLTEASTDACADGLDNDCDGSLDAEDPDCSGFLGDDDDSVGDDDDSAGDDDDSPGRVASLCACSSAPLSGGQAPGLLGLLLVYGWRRRGSSR